MNDDGFLGLATGASVYSYWFSFSCANNKNVANVVNVTFL